MTEMQTTSENHWQRLWDWRHTLIAVIAVLGIAVFVVTKYAFFQNQIADYTLWVVILIGGIPLVAELLIGILRGQWGSDLLAGISIVTAVFLGEPLAAALVVLMLSGGAALEAFAVRRASSVLQALASRMPSIAHRKTESGLIEIPLAEIKIGDELVVLPHELCPVDGIVTVGHGSMDESYLTGEPYRISKSTGSEVISGAINGNDTLTIRATKLASDSRYARIMTVMEQSQQQRPALRRLGDQLGAWYTPLAVAIALLAWWWSGDAIRFLAVLVVATPCPLLIAIPVAIIGSISLAARRSIIVRDPAVLEQIGSCHTMMFDKTGTLTYGEPNLVEQIILPAFEQQPVLQWAASLEQYSKHPLAQPLIIAAQQAGLKLLPAEQVSELPGQGLIGQVAQRQVRITHRKQLLKEQPHLQDQLPASVGGLECMAMVDGQLAAIFRFRDQARTEGPALVKHWGRVHHINRLLMISGDRREEVEYLAQQVGITELFAGQTPEQKLAIVTAETTKCKTIYVGDGINDAPAMLASTVGIAMGQRSEVTSAAAGAIILDNHLAKVDELLHIGMRMKRIALQSALGGMALSIVGMGLAAYGLLTPVWGALLQEMIDVLAVLNALRAAVPPREISDFHG